MSDNSKRSEFVYPAKHYPEDTRDTWGKQDSVYAAGWDGPRYSGDVGVGSVSLAAYRKER